MELWYLSRNKRRELLLIQLFDADPDVVSKFEVQKNLLLAVEVVLMSWMTSALC
jgi:hypothetical protein